LTSRSENDLLADRGSPKEQGPAHLWQANPLTIKHSVVLVYAADNSRRTSGRFKATAMSDFAAPDG
jgi:hypothetical protein